MGVILCKMPESFFYGIAQQKTKQDFYQTTIKTHKIHFICFFLSPSVPLHAGGNPKGGGGKKVR